jgi:hypothetical protein
MIAGLSPLVRVQLHVSQAGPVVHHVVGRDVARAAATGASRPGAGWATYPGLDGLIGPEGDPGQQVLDVDRLTGVGLDKATI